MSELNNTHVCLHTEMSQKGEEINANNEEMPVERNPHFEEEEAPEGKELGTAGAHGVGAGPGAMSKKCFQNHRKGRLCQNR